MKQVQLPCCMGGVRVTVKNKWTNMSKNKRNFIITELLLGVLLVIGIGLSHTISSMKNRSVLQL